MELQYCSDLHLEFDRNRKWIQKHPIAAAADILLLGGDIIPFAQLQQHNDFLDYIAANFKATYWIPGNHEYYHSDINQRSGTLHEPIRNNVFLVNNTSVTIDDTELICGTLWSHIDPVNEWPITRAMSDFHRIRKGAGKFSTGDYNALHDRSRNFITQALATSKARRKIVITHHVPTLQNYPPKYKGDVLNEAFATELHDFIAKCGADYWIYGHTHSNTPDFKIGNTWLSTNQLGYVQYGENNHFTNPKILTLS